MDHNDLHAIDYLPKEESRIKVTTFLKEQLVPLSGDLDQAVGAAYGIAGLMATDYARNLKTGDRIDEILSIAGELEIYPDNAEELRGELIAKITALN